MIPEWVDRDQFPFVVHTFDSHDGRLAYVDEGKGRTLLFLHGNPGWSFLYRHLIAGLSKPYRCVALDMLGFGLSEKPASADHSPQAHAERLDEFIAHLGLDRVTLVMHDFGGPIGLSWAERNPSRVDGLILFNSWMWSLRRNPDAMHLFKNFDSPFNRIYYTILPASPKFFLPVLVADAHTMPKHILEQFLFPFHEHRSRGGPYGLARQLIRASNWFDELWDRKELIEDIPMLLLWGENDKISGEGGLQRFAEHFPCSRVVRLPGAGNFVPQDVAPRALIEIKGFLRSSGSAISLPKSLIDWD